MKTVAIKLGLLAAVEEETGQTIFFFCRESITKKLGSSVQTVTGTVFRMGPIRSIRTVAHNKTPTNVPL